MKPKSSEYILDCRKSYSLYIMRSRAIPSVTDGMKSAHRRVIWTARNGQKWKTASLAGATMPLHPHSAPEDAINTITAPYGNNIPLFKGYGAFGTLLGPKDYGAGRYTSVTLSKFTEDVVLRDIEIIPMMDNYDNTLQEPQHFLPLIPLVLLNPTEGIAIGFATNILPRSLDNIIDTQIKVLLNKKLPDDILPNFTPLQSISHEGEITDKGRTYYFNGVFERVSTTMIKITKIPYGQLHSKVIAKLDAEVDTGINIIDYMDNSRDVIEIVVKFKKGVLSKLEDDTILKMLNLTIKHCENMNVLDFTGQAVWTTNPIDVIQHYTNWRLQWYITRYERLRDLLLIELQKYLDIKKAIEKNVGGIARKIQSRRELKEFLEAINIVYIDYIADLPVYRFTEEEKRKNDDKIVEANKQLAIYNDLLNSEQKRKDIYVQELTEILTNYKKGKYNNE